jgi:hypothetical protein
MYIVKARFFETVNKGTERERRTIEYYPHNNGPFATRESAESFARGLATHSDIAVVEIEETEGEE